MNSKSKSPTYKRIVLYSALPVVVFIITAIPGFELVTTYAALGLVLVLIALHSVHRVARSIRVAVWTVFVLLLVGSTGWFHSPFFFALYFLAVSLGFVFTFSAAASFTIALLIVFILSAELNVAYDFFILLSLLSALPLTLALRKSFLLVQQEKKGILILEDDKRGEGVTTLEAILQNRVNRVGILLRQPITYIKQGLSMLHDGKLSGDEEQDVVHRMQRSTDEMFTLVKNFEQGATNNDLLAGSTTSTEEQTKQT